MIADRTQLAILENENLANSKIRIATEGGDVRTYSLLKLLGKGKTGVAWQASDQLDRTWAIKFVLNRDYQNHSLAAEAMRVAKMKSRYLARIDFYGTPLLLDETVDLSPFYAIVVEWIPGKSLKNHLADVNSNLTVRSLLRLTRTLCDVVTELRANQLTHNDLHSENIIISTSRDVFTDEEIVDAMVIDTGTMKTEERLLELIESWRNEIAVLEKLGAELAQDFRPQITRLEEWIRWFGRSDQEWIVYHLCSISNAMQARLALHDSPTKRFLWKLPSLLDQMIDPDLGRRLAEPILMYQQLEHLWVESTQPERPKMTSPFDLMSAELIRDDRQLRDLFSVEFPGLKDCQGSDPIYLYGPRGCGKSTILRAISFKSLLTTESPLEELKKLPFVGVYLACSSELRSRFWLIPEADYELTEPHVIRFFNLLLVEQLVDTLEMMYLWDAAHDGEALFGMRDNQASELCERIRHRVVISNSRGRYFSTSPFAVLKLQIRSERDHLWSKILDREPATSRTDAQLIFDICKELADSSPFFSARQVAFLLDDYSQQRIPAALQRKLNQAITFSKQGNPIFKVTSEYGGVDLAGIQEGREVREINIGLEYVDLSDNTRWRFLKNLLSAHLVCDISEFRWVREFRTHRRPASSGVAGSFAAVWLTRL